ncbi:glutamine--scyllo-inositol transaminase [Leptolyngbya sp. Heron Island J]|uniref:DegT/DnrJ/EryC1/StrS family aminotransferase n=1 Tax=Leptolyngbya sp. Heron Island J TaxID=1385935 RepID=UPI0003B9B387|nr:DegT/DnrJ/EryC1/StrS family aminotransferase [Leptolyngbya sp. Heron Island J]ESA31978.1 glutamine--scyllo-inositol transaminase [Leptolyngbya sp. Heron Island J]
MASPSFVPFVDLAQQHHPLRSELLAAMAAVADRGDYILGRSVLQFEQSFAAACGVCHGVGVGSGTDALTLGLQACGVGPGDQVVLPVNTFVATLIGVLQAGATPVFVDCDLKTGLMDLTAVEQAITRRTRAIIPVHLYGQMVSPLALRALAKAYDVIVFEDAAQAHGAEREGLKAGSVGLAAAFSFYPSKNLGAMGDGGMVVAQQELVAQTVRSLRNYGSTRKYYHTDPGGTNSRLDTLQAAVLQIKLAHLDAWNCDRNRLAKLYDQALSPLAHSGIFPMVNDSGSGHVYHLYVIRLTQDCPVDRTRLQQELAAEDIQSGIHYPVPCHLQPAFHHLGCGAGNFPIAERLSQEILSLPMFPGMTDNQLEYVVETIAKVVKAHPVLI